MKPHIVRSWHAQRGGFAWQVSNAPPNRWGMGSNPEERKLWDAALAWVSCANKKELL